MLFHINDIVGKSLNVLLVEESFGYLGMRIGSVGFAGEASQGRIPGRAPMGIMDSSPGMLFTHLGTTGVHHYHGSGRCVRIGSLHVPLLIEFLNNLVLESFNLSSDSICKFANVLFRYDQFGKFFEVMSSLSV